MDRSTDEHIDGRTDERTDRTLASAHVDYM